MERQYYIMISANARTGYECLAQYSLGNDKNQADEIFSQLQGSDIATERTKLHLDLVEIVDELPISVKTICCTPEEFSHNTGLIVRSLFFE